MSRSRAHHAPARRVAAIIGLTVLASVTIAPAMPALAGPKTQADVHDYAQCANGAPPSTSTSCPEGWINGALNANNSHYVEDDVTAQRLLMKLPSNSPTTGRTVTLSYQARKGSIHAYDSLATWDVTQSTADRCAGLKGNSCPGGAPSQMVIPSDTTEVQPVGDGIDPKTSAHELPAEQRKMTLYGGTITNISAPVHTNAAGSGDDYASITITYEVPSTPATVQFVFGGHLAAQAGPRGWGAGLGSASISGGPYHIRVTSADGASVGNRDNQIMGAAIRAAEPGLNVTKSASNGTIQAGETAEFEITVSNDGAGAATNVTVTDALPTGPGISWSVSQQPAQGSCSIDGSQVLSCSLGDLAAGASVTIKVSSPTSTDNCGATLENAEVSVSADNHETVTAGPSSIEVNCQPGLSVNKTASSGTIKAGDDATFQISVSNAGPGVAENVTVTDALPTGAGISWSVTQQPAQGSCSIDGSQVLSCSLGDVAAGTTLTIEVTTATNTSDHCGATLQNPEVSVSADNHETITDGPVSIGVECDPDLSVVKSASNGTINAGDNATFTITVTNDGPGVAENVTLTDALPTGDGISWSVSQQPSQGSCSVDGSQTLTCSFGDLAPGSVSVQVTTSTSSANCGAVLENATVSVSADNHETVQAQPASITVECAPDLNVSKSSCPGTIPPGGFLTYDLAYSNDGVGPATNATMKDTIPAGTTVVDDGGGTVSGDGSMVTFDLGTLEPGDSGTRTIVVQVDPSTPDGTVLTNTVELTSDQASATTFTLDTTVTNAGAATQGSSFGLDVVTLDNVLIDMLNFQSTSASAPSGSDAAAGEILAIPASPVVEASVVRGTSQSDVGGDAVSTATATTLDVNLLDGAITATAVHGVSQSSADAFTSSYNSTGSHFVDLVINGEPILNVAPNQTVDVSNPDGSNQKIARAVLYEETGSTGTNGDNTSSHTVNMIHVTLLKPFAGLDRGAEIIVSSASTEATYPNGRACGTQPPTVSGDAFSASAEGLIGGEQVAFVQHGDAEIPPTGGSDADHIENLSVPGAVTAATTDNTSCGSLTDATACGGAGSNPYATSRSLLQGVNILDGLITADVIDVTATSSADGTTAGTSLTATFANLVVDGEVLDVSQSPNSTTTVSLGGGQFAVIILNEQITNTSGGTDTAGTVNAIHVLVFNALGVLDAEIIVGHAHSDAHTA